MRAKTTLAGQSDLRVRHLPEGRTNLCTRRIERRSRSRDVPGECPEAIRIEPFRHVDPQPELAFQERCVGALLAVHGRENRGDTRIGPRLRPVEVREGVV